MSTSSATSRTVKIRFPLTTARTLLSWSSFVDVEGHPNLRQIVSGTAQAMWHKIQIARHFTVRTEVHSPLSNCFINTDYQRRQKYWIFVKREQHSTKIHKLNSVSEVITWSIIDSWISFSATSDNCDILSFKTIQ